MSKHMKGNEAMRSQVSMLWKCIFYLVLIQFSVKICLFWNCLLHPCCHDLLNIRLSCNWLQHWRLYSLIVFSFHTQLALQTVSIWLHGTMTVLYYLPKKQYILEAGCITTSDEETWFKSRISWLPSMPILRQSHTYTTKSPQCAFWLMTSDRQIMLNDSQG